VVKVGKGFKRNFKHVLTAGVMVLIFTILNYSPIFLYALKQEIKFDHISIEDGLSQSSVNCILKDRRGLMWFGTQDGLNRYDGYKFKIYRHQPDNSNSISDSHINCFYEDRKGVLWVGTREGLDHFDREKEIFIRYKKDQPPPFKLSDNEIVAIGEDREGVLWIGTFAGGINKFDLKKNHFVVFQHDIYDSTTLNSNRISTLYIDSSDVLWIGTQDVGLDRFDRKNGKFFHYIHNASDPNSLSNNYVTAIAADRQGELWIGTKMGLNQLDPKTNTFIHYKHMPNDPGSISNNEINCIYPVHDGGLLVGTEEGLNEFNPGNKTFSRWKNDPLDPDSLSNNVILAIYQDPAHILWIGTNGGGFNKYAPSKDRFAHYQFNPHRASRGLSSNMVYAICEDRAGIVWLGTNKGLNRFDPANNQFTSYKSEPGNSRSLGNDYVFSIYEDRAGVLWVGTWGGGLNKFDRETGTFTHYLSNPGEEQSLSSNIVLAIYEDRRGGMWIGTEGSGINKFDREKQTFLQYRTVEEDPTTISSNYINSICEDPSDALWIGTKYGLDKFDWHTGKFIRYTVNANESNSLAHNEVNVIVPGSQGILWIGTSGGLDKFDPKTNQFSHYGEADGLPNDVICGMLEDGQGNLWISTNKGLSKFDPRQGAFRNYGTKDGLQSSEFNVGAFCKIGKSKMAFGGINGFNLFHPENIKDNLTIPPIIITELRVFNQSTGEMTDFPLGKSIMDTTDINLSYRVQVISFEFAALDYTSPPGNRYAYKMEGLDRDWIDAGARRAASYTSLPPGDYIFRVKGTNSDGVWNETGTMLQLHIMPPFWQTWWFRGLLALMLVVLFLVLYQARTRNIKARTKQLEEINEKLNCEVTERKQAEEKLQKSERRIRTFLETASEGFLELDNQEIILDVNPEMCAILGCAREDLLGRDFLDFIATMDLAKFLQDIEVRENGNRSSYSLAFVRPDNTTAHCVVKTVPLFDENQDVKGLFAMVTNITEIVQAEQELQRTKRYLDNVFNSLSSMLISVDREGVITQWNTAAEKYIGVPADWAVSKKVWDVIPFLRFYQDQLEQVFRSRKTFELHREPMIIGKGEPKYLDISVYPLAYQGLAGSVIRMDDVTELEKKDRQLIQAQKMETVGSLVGGLAHDFNNVLGGIVGTVSLLKYLLEKNKTVSIEKIMSSVETIEKGACRAGNLVSQLLTLSRKKEPLFVSVDLNEAVKDVMQICENTFDKSIKLEISYHDKKAMVWADTTQIQQVMLNLCINASHAMTLMRKMDDPQGGTLSVSILDFYVDQYFCASQPEAIEENYWVLKIKDTGVGIEPKFISKIFDPFYTTKTKTQGTGLGLAMVYNIVKQHRGFIDVESHPGIGTTFSIYFPQLEEQKFHDTKPLELEALTTGTGLILIVDDEESLRLTLKEILETCGYNVLLAEDGRQGLKIFKQRCNEIKLILLDLAMPNMSGKDSYIEMKKIFPSVKVLVISGFKHDQRVREIRELGVNGYLAKPFTMAELSRKIAEVIQS
jgi:PAS domain S-box-containing protein